MDAWMDIGYGIDRIDRCLLCLLNPVRDGLDMNRWEVMRNANYYSSSCW
jgi:hypothetical protein